MEVLITVRYLGTAFLIIALVSLFTLLAGILRTWTKLFIPYFAFTTVMVTTAILGSLYSLYQPGQRKLALVELMFALMETKLLLSVASYYKQLKVRRAVDEGESSVDVRGSFKWEKC